LKQHLKRHGLSGGQQQQLAIARGRVTQVMLLDEPTEGIQPSIVQIDETLRRINRERESHYWL